MKKKKYNKTPKKIKVIKKPKIAKKPKKAQKQKTKKKLFISLGKRKSTYQINKHKSGMNYYVDKKGEYKIKPFYATFWREGFLDDVPVGSDYNRVMDGIVHTDSIIDPLDYPNKEAYLRAVRREEHRGLYGLERAQISIMRLWNGSPREWVKLIFRIVLIAGIFALFFAIGRPLLTPIFG